LRQVLGGTNDDEPGIGKDLRRRTQAAGHLLKALGFVTVPAAELKTATPTASGYWGLARDGVGFVFDQQGERSVVHVLRNGKPLARLEATTPVYQYIHSLNYVPAAKALVVESAFEEPEGCPPPTDVAESALLPLDLEALSAAAP
jgi:hypothetical protein